MLPSSDSVAMCITADNMKVKGKKSGSVAAFGTVNAHALMVSLMDNSVNYPW
jgi:hypothetical protein